MLSSTVEPKAVSLLSLDDEIYSVLAILSVF